MMNGGKKTAVRALTITSGKGGVGKTNVVTNLAMGLQSKDKSVLVFDADMGLGNVDILLGLAPKFNLQDVLSGKKSIEEIIVEGPGGINILPATSGVQELTQLDKESRLVLVEELDRISAQYDFLLFDTQHAPVEIKELGPSIRSIRGGEGVPIVRVGENRADQICFDSFPLHWCANFG